MTVPMMTESLLRLELIMPMTELSPGTWAATPFMRAWICDRPDRCAANSARVAYACLARVVDDRRSVTPRLGENVNLAHSSVASAIR